MNEPERLQALQQRTHLITDLPNDRALQVERCAEFTRRAAWELRDLGWGNVRKEAGANVRGLSIDKIINGRTGEMRDIIVSSDSENPHLTWDLVDANASLSFYVAPVAPPDAPPEVPPGPKPEDPPAPKPKPDPNPPLDEADLDRFLRAAEAHAKSMVAMTEQLAAIEPTLDSIAESLAKRAAQGGDVTEFTAARIASALDTVAQRLDQFGDLGRFFELLLKLRTGRDLLPGDAPSV